MIFEQFYLGCLAQASYLIGNEGDAVIVDPQRDVDIYVEAADRLGLKIRHVVETHLHADFVSGHVELQERTGAQIYFGQKCDAEFDHVKVQNGDRIELGRVRIEFMETPGHTPESICVLIRDTSNTEKPLRLLTGDTLFVGDVGRPDLVGSKGYTPEEMAGMLYDSLHEKILELPDDTMVFPGHGAGSSCGKNIGQERYSTLGEQRELNYALRPMKREAFVKKMTLNLAKPPAYFSKGAELNRQGPKALGDLPKLPKLAADEIIREMNRGILLIDVRDFLSFGKEHIPDSINIQLDGPYAPWAGSLLSFEKPVLLLGENDEKVDEARVRLARVGFENVLGYVENGLDGWRNAGLSTSSLKQVRVEDLKKMLAKPATCQIIDVRNQAEYEQGRIPGAINIPLSSFRPGEDDALKGIDLSKPSIFVCAGGYRSSIAASIQLMKSKSKLSNLIGGTQAWSDAGFPLET